MGVKLSEKLTLEGKSLRNKLTLINVLISVVPLSVFAYILYKEDVFPRLDHLSLTILALLLLLILASMIILRQIFDNFMTVAVLMKKAETGEIAMLEMQKDTAELNAISTSFNKVLKKLEDTSKVLGDQTIALENEMAKRKQAEDALKESEERYKKLLDSLNDYIREKMTEKHKPFQQ